VIAETRVQRFHLAWRSVIGAQFVDALVHFLVSFVRVGGADGDGRYPGAQGQDQHAHKEARPSAERLAENAT